MRLGRNTEDVEHDGLGVVVIGCKGQSAGPRTRDAEEEDLWAPGGWENVPRH